VAPVMIKSAWQRYKTKLKQSNLTAETSFIVVRHPFERLVSAYRDKIERTHAKNYLLDFYYKAYGRKIVAQFRKRSLQKFGDQFFR
jgi:hypothetical protein